MQWAILSGIEGNLAAYEAVLQDIQRQPISVTDLYILGNVVGLKGDNEAVIQRLRSPQAGELKPEVCIGWWEEQCFSLHGLNATPEAPELKEQCSGDEIKQLWDSVSRETVHWLRNLHFGFHELDCLLIHGSTEGYADELTPTTSPAILCDRLIRADANTLFCGRSGLSFECQVTPDNLQSTVTTLDGSQEPQNQGKSPRRVVGIGSVSRNPEEASYVLYNPGSNVVTFQQVNTRVLSH